MIKTEHAAWAEFVFKIYINRLLKKSFDSFYLIGEIPQKNHKESVLLLPNHNTWWDGFFVYYLNSIIWQKTLFLMMLEEQLKKLSFFKKVGAFGISRNSPKEILKALNYSSDILNRKYSIDPPVLAMFPQGELQPYSKNSLNYLKGYERVIDNVSEKLAVYQLGIKAELFDQQKPSVYFSFDELRSENIDQAITNHKLLLEKIESSISEKDQHICLLRGKASVSDKYV